MTKKKPDLVIITTFNKILNNNILKLSNFINFHHEKFPEQKVRAGINQAIIISRREIYIAIHKRSIALDSEEVICQKKIIIKKLDNCSTIKNKINLFIKSNLAKIILKYLDKKLILKKNNNKKETWNCGRNPENSLKNFIPQEGI